MKGIIDIETAGTWDPKIQSLCPNKKDGGRELSFGLVQIHLPDHPEVTLEQATDAQFSVDFLIQALKEGRGNQWTSYRSITK